MKCPKCGKDNPDIRLFCMNCGELMPEEETIENETVVEVNPETGIAPAETEQPAEVVEPDTSEDTEFFRNRERSRRVIEEAWPEEENKPKSVSIPSIFDAEEDESAPQTDNEYARPGRYEVRQRPVLEKTASVSHGQPSTIIPKRSENLEPDDFFAVKGQVLPEYDDEELIKVRKTNRKRKGREYEDDDHQSFFVRHMRGFVSILLLLLTAIIVLVWANTDNAQLTFARLDMAWKPEAYAILAEEAYAAKDLSAAGYYYSRALSKDETNYNYAVMAANSYIEGGYNSKALEAVRKCIVLKPDDVNLYAMLIELQPDRENIPESDMELIRQGYTITKDERLNIE